jgi:hypothetical protein
MRSLTEDALVLDTDRSVTLARRPLQRRAVDDRQPPPISPDETFPFHSADRRRDAGPPHADGPAEGLVGERDFMAVQAVLSDEKLAGQPLL